MWNCGAIFRFGKPGKCVPVMRALTPQTYLQHAKLAKENQFGALDSQNLAYVRKNI